VFFPTPTQIPASLRLNRRAHWPRLIGTAPEARTLTRSHALRQAAPRVDPPVKPEGYGWGMGQDRPPHPRPMSPTHPPDRAPAGQAAPAEAPRAVSATETTRPTGRRRFRAAPAERPRRVSAKMTESEGCAGLATRLVFVQESTPGCESPAAKERKSAGFQGSRRGDRPRPHAEMTVSRPTGPVRTRIYDPPPPVSGVTGINTGVKT